MTKDQYKGLASVCVVYMIVQAISVRRGWFPPYGNYLLIVAAWIAGVIWCWARYKISTNIYRNIVFSLFLVCILCNGIAVLANDGKMPVLADRVWLQKNMSTNEVRHSIATDAVRVPWLVDRVSMGGGVAICSVGDLAAFTGLFVASVGWYVKKKTQEVVS